MKEETEGRLARAEELLVVAEENLANAHPADSVSRAYYAMFHSATAILLKIGVERSSHKGIISAFGEKVIKTGKMDKRFHAYLRDAFDSRSVSDYLPFPDQDATQAKETLSQAKEFVQACRTLLHEGL